MRSDRTGIVERDEMKLGHALRSVLNPGPCGYLDLNMIVDAAAICVIL